MVLIERSSMLVLEFDAAVKSEDIGSLRLSPRSYSKRSRLAFPCPFSCRCVPLEKVLEKMLLIGGKLQVASFRNMGGYIRGMVTRGMSRVPFPDQK